MLQETYSRNEHVGSVHGALCAVLHWFAGELTEDLISVSIGEFHLYHLSCQALVSWSLRPEELETLIVACQGWYYFLLKNA